jgi:hypothetical protein
VGTGGGRGDRVLAGGGGSRVSKAGDKVMMGQEVLSSFYQVRGGKGCCMTVPRWAIATTRCRGPDGGRGGAPGGHTKAERNASKHGS